MKRELLIGFIVCSLLTGVSPVSAGGFDEMVTGNPEMDVTLTANRVDASDAGQFRVTVSNSGDVRKTGPEPFVERVKTARNVKLTLLASRIDAPIEITSGTVVLGAVPDGQPRTATFNYETGSELQPGTYQIPIRIEYDYTSAIGYDTTSRPPGYTDAEYIDSSRQTTNYLTVVVDEQSQFELTPDATDLYGGDTETLRFDVQNTGTETARNATIRLTSESPNVFFGDFTRPQSNTSVLVSELAPDETSTATVKVGARSDITDGTYPIAARVVYENENGMIATSDPLTISVRARPERRFTLRNVQPTTARAGDDDVVVSATIVNEGPATAHNAIVTAALAGTTSADIPHNSAANDTSSIRITNEISSVGTLAPNASRPVRFRLMIPREVERGDRILAFTVEYENDEGDVRRIRTPVRKSIRVGPEVDRFSVRGVETNVSTDTSNRIVVSVRNTANVTYRDVTVQLSPDPPFTSVSPGAFVSTLAPGETARLQYELTVADDAVPSTHGIRATVIAEEPDGDTYRSDVKRIPIEIRRQQFLEQDWTSVLIGGVIVMVLLGGGYLLVLRE